MTRDQEYAKAIASTQDQAELQELSKQFMADKGYIKRLPGVSDIEVYAQPTAPAPRPIRDNREATCLRVIYPHGNARIEISGMSEDELDAIQARIEASFNQ